MQRDLLKFRWNPAGLEWIDSIAGDDLSSNDGVNDPQLLFPFLGG